MDARSAHRIRQRHSVIDYVENYLVSRRDDPRTAPRTSYQEKVSARIENDCRRHSAQHPLAGRDRIGLALDQAEHVGRSRFRGEVVHLVVEKKTGTSDEYAGTVQVVQ